MKEWLKRENENDNSLLEDFRQEVKRQQAARLRQKLDENIKLQAMAMAALEAKDLSRTSARTLSEMYHAASAEELEIYRQLQVENAGEEFKIEIVKADEEKD